MHFTPISVIYLINKLLLKTNTLYKSMKNVVTSVDLTSWRAAGSTGSDSAEFFRNITAPRKMVKDSKKNR